MTTVLAFEPGGYRYTPGSPQFSEGVAALEGFRIVRIRFTRPLPLASGFDAIAACLSQAGRPRTALCACELRSPEPLDDAGFDAFNRAYTARLGDWGLDGAGASPVARSNVCPVFQPPSEPGVVAFSFTEPAPGAEPSFVLSGCAEARPGSEPYAARVVRYRDISADGLRAKARFVREVIEARAAVLGIALDQLTGTQVYSAHEIHGLVMPGCLPDASLRQGVTWQLCRPPVVGLEYELDCRAVPSERVMVVR